MTTSKADFHDKRLPNESPEYRAARNELLAEEVSLREQLERVAVLRRRLPLGGELKEDYEFEEIDLSDGSTRPIRFSEIFGENTDLLVYSYMYGPDWESPCPSCTSVIDGINAASRHVRQQVELVVIGKATPAQLYDIAKERNWQDLRLLSSEKNDYAHDYHSQPGETSESLMPVLNAFKKESDRIRHFWASELLWTPMAGGHPRHVDIIWPVWGLLDMTRSGRHPEKTPQLHYQE
jgi:predicted dithiol-disulfide oxidoreductase (DUF899 family)